MSTDNKSIWEQANTRQLVSALVSINDTPTLENFLRDVMTEKEIIEISSRLEAARMLQAGEKYTDIVKQTKLSSRTIARISDWMQNGTGGYNSVLASLKAEK